MSPQVPPGTKPLVSTLRTEPGLLHMEKNLTTGSVLRNVLYFSLRFRFIMHSFFRRLNPPSDKLPGTRLPAVCPLCVRYPESCVNSAGRS